MPIVHFFTAQGSLCDPALSSRRLTLVREGVTCQACRVALAQQQREEAAQASAGPRVIARVRVRSAWQRILSLD